MSYERISDEAVTLQPSGLFAVKLADAKDKKIGGLTEALVHAHKIVDDAGAVRDPFLVATVFMALINPNNEQR